MEPWKLGVKDPLIAPIVDAGEADNTVFMPLKLTACDCPL